MIHDRQARLAEVGADGQARIEAASFAVAGEGAGFAALYLHRAGAQRLTVSIGAAGASCPHAAEFRFAAARELGSGAWRALSELRRALGVGPEAV